MWLPSPSTAHFWGGLTLIFLELCRFCPLSLGLLSGNLLPHICGPRASAPMALGQRVAVAAAAPPAGRPQVPRALLLGRRRRNILRPLSTLSCQPVKAGPSRAAVHTWMSVCTSARASVGVNTLLSCTLVPVQNLLRSVFSVMALVCGDLYTLVHD